MPITTLNNITAIPFISKEEEYRSLSLSGGGGATGATRRRWVGACKTKWVLHVADILNIRCLPIYDHWWEQVLFFVRNQMRLNVHLNFLPNALHMANLPYENSRVSPPSCLPPSNSNGGGLPLGRTSVSLEVNSLQFWSEAHGSQVCWVIFGK